MFIGEESLKNIFPSDLGAFCSSNVKLVGNKAKGRISKLVFQENKARQIFQKNEHFLPINTHTFLSFYICVLFGKTVWVAVSLYWMLWITNSTVIQRCFLREVLLGISQNSQENTCVRVSLKERLWYRCFPVNFAKFLRTFFFTEGLL